MKSYLSLVMHGFRRSKWFLFSTIILMTTVMTLSSLVISINKKLYFDKLPYQNPQDINLLFSTIDTGMGRVSGNAKGLVYFWRDLLISEVPFAIEKTSNIKVNFGDYDSKARISYISPQYTKIFGLTLSDGHFFSTENINTAINEVLITKTFAKKHSINFQKKPFLVLENKSYQIVGIVDEKFIEPSKLAGDEIDIWLPININDSAKTDYNRFDSGLNFYLRTDDIKNITDEIEAKTITFLRANNSLELIENKNITIESIPLSKKVLEKSKKSSLLVLITIFILSIMILSIIVNNLISRYIGRIGIYTIHTVLGATFKDIFKWITLEIIIISFFSIMASIALSYYLVSILKTLLKNDVPRILEVSIDFNFIIILTSIVSIIIATLLHLIKKEIASRELIKTLKSGTKGKTTSNGTVRGVILTIQTTVSIICITVSIYVYTLSQQEMASANTYNPGNLHYMQIHLPSDSIMAKQKRVIGKAIKSKLIEKDLYSTINYIDNLPLGRGVGLYDVFDMNNELLTSTQVNGVESDYFSLLEIDIVKGRAFNKSEINNNENVVMINQEFSNIIFGNDSIGKKIVYENSIYQVIGVVKNINNPFVKVSGSEYKIYIPYIHYDYVPVQSFLMKPKGANLTLVKKLVKEINPQLSLSEWSKVSSLHKELFVAHKLRITIAILALLVAFIFMIEGLRNIISLLIQSSSNELSVRIVSGAKKKDIDKHIMKIFIPFISIGILVSTIIILLLNRYEYFVKDQPFTILYYLIISILIVSTVFFTLSKIHLNQFLNKKSILIR